MVVVTGRAGLLLRPDDDGPRPVGEPAEALAGVERRGLALGDEALLRGLLGHAHAAADVGPGGPGPPGLVDEVADERVGDLAEVVGQQDGAGQPVERLVVLRRRSRR